MATTTFKIAKGEFGISLTDPGKTLAQAAIADYDDFSCVVTAGSLVATQNFDSEDVPGTFCDPPGTTTNPSATTFELQLEVLQDPQDDTVAGLAKFLYDNDSGVSGNSAFFYLGLADGTAPKAIGECYLAPMDFGGQARVVLTASLALPVEGRPEIEFGTAAPTP